MRLYPHTDALTYVTASKSCLRLVHHRWRRADGLTTEPKRREVIVVVGGACFTRQAVSRMTDWHGNPEACEELGFRPCIKSVLTRLDLSGDCMWLSSARITNLKSLKYA
jgi:hypothetical protein